MDDHVFCLISIYVLDSQRLDLLFEKIKRTAVLINEKYGSKQSLWTALTQVCATPQNVGFMTNASLDPINI